MYPPDGEDYKFIVIERRMGYEFHKTAEGAVHSFKQREEALSQLPFKPGTVLLTEIVMATTFYRQDDGQEMRKRYGRPSRAEELLGCDVEQYLDGADLAIGKPSAASTGLFVAIEEKETEADAGESELAGS